MAKMIDTRRHTVGKEDQRTHAPPARAASIEDACTCTVCREAFAEWDRPSLVPRILSSCGHTICTGTCTYIHTAWSVSVACLLCITYCVLDTYSKVFQVFVWFSYQVIIVSTSPLQDVSLNWLVAVLNRPTMKSLVQCAEQLQVYRTAMSPTYQVTGVSLPLSRVSTMEQRPTTRVFVKWAAAKIQWCTNVRSAKSICVLRAPRALFAEQAVHTVLRRFTHTDHCHLLPQPVKGVKTGCVQSTI